MPKNLLILTMLLLSLLSFSACGDDDETEAEAENNHYADLIVGTWEADNVDNDYHDWIDFQSDGNCVMDVRGGDPGETFCCIYKIKGETIIFIEDYDEDPWIVNIVELTKQRLTVDDNGQTASFHRK